MKKFLLAALAGVAGMLAMATPAFAAPTPPTPVTIAESALSAFIDAAMDVFTALVTNSWVLAAFGVGIALSFAAAIIATVRRRTSRPVAR